MNIVLVGMSGSGKTTVAHALSKLNGMECIDTDEQIEREFGKISDIFKERGEEFFRDIETEVILQLSQLQSSIISTGGGCLLRPKNALVLKKNGKIVYLRTSVSELCKRLNSDYGRPLLVGDTQRKLKEMHAVREPIYLANADLIIDTDGLSADEVAKAIGENLK